MSEIPWHVLHTASKVVVRQRLDLKVEGLDRVPSQGPVLIAARHFHHLHDGCALLATLSRPAHILVALDWVTHPVGRVVMERACQAASWPVVARTSGPTGAGVQEAASAFRRAVRESLKLWQDSRIVIVFPEGYPTIDPGFTPKRDENEFLPFQRGYTRLVTIAAREGIRVPIVPAGLSYERGERWHVRLRFGSPVYLDSPRQEHEAIHAVEAQIRDLSRS